MNLTDNQKSVLAEVILSRMDEISKARVLFTTAEANKAIDAELSTLRDILNEITKQH